MSCQLQITRCVSRGIYLQVLPPRGRDPLPKHGAPNLHVDLVERAHGGLDVVLIHLVEEALDGFLGLRARRIRADRRRVARRARPGRRRRRLVQQQELDVAGRHEAGYVICEELVDYLEVSARLASAT